jgi:hypothetical protein
MDWKDQTDEADLMRTRYAITYHGRSGHPVIHRTKYGREYIMVRAEDGKGNKRLYEGSKYWTGKQFKKLKL